MGEEHRHGTGDRKAEHLHLALSDDVGFHGLTTGLEAVRVAHRALPDRPLDDVDLAIDLWGRSVRTPILISCMTGGVSEAGQVNRALAEAAQAHGVAFGLGSGRALLEDPGQRTSYAVRDIAPDVLLLANLGAAQLVEGGPSAGSRVVELCEADALAVHLNPLQEAVQPGGDTDWRGVLAAIERLCATLQVPVVAKEVGFGLASADVERLLAAGVAGIDVAGAGGTNWARIEGHRDARAGRVAAAFRAWGWPTATCLRHARGVLDTAGSGALLIGSGGVRDGVDALKVLCLGADLAGVARGLLAAGAAGPDAAVEAVGVLVEQLRIGAWAAGAAAADDLGPGLLQPSGPLESRLGEDRAPTAG